AGGREGLVATGMIEGGPAGASATSSPSISSMRSSSLSSSTPASTAASTGLAALIGALDTTAPNSSGGGSVIRGVWATGSPLEERRSDTGADYRTISTRRFAL